MFKIISGDFEKTAIYANEKLIESKSSTYLYNAEKITILSEEEIKELLYNAEYSKYAKELEKALKNIKIVCFEYKFTNGKNFKAIADLNIFHKIQKTGEKTIPEEKLTKANSKGCLIAIIIFIFLLILVNCVGNKQDSSNHNANNATELSKTDYRINVASPKQVKYLKEFLKPNFQIVDENRVYYVKSNDYQNAYFIGTMVKHINRLELCIWFANKFDDTSGTILSANDGAVYSSYPLDARKTDIQVKSYDDGYNQVHRQVLKHFNELAK